MEESGIVGITQIIMQVMDILNVIGAIENLVIISFAKLLTEWEQIIQTNMQDILDQDIKTGIELPSEDTGMLASNKEIQIQLM